MTDTISITSTTATSSIPIVTAPASAFGVFMSPILNTATHIGAVIGGILSANGLAQVTASMLDPMTGTWSSVAQGNLWIGILLAGASYAVSHYATTASNEVTTSALSGNIPA